MTTEPSQNPLDKSPLDRTEDEHALAAELGRTGQGSVVQMIRVLRDAIVTQQNATNRLTNHIRWLNWALLAVAIAVAVMTLVEVWEPLLRVLDRFF